MPLNIWYPAGQTRVSLEGLSPLMIDQSVFERTDVPVVCADAHGYITRVNDRFADAFGWATTDLAGRPLSTIIPERFHVAHHMGFSRFLTTEVPTLLGQPIMLWIVAKDGQETEAEHVIVAENREGSWAFAAMITPVA